MPNTRYQRRVHGNRVRSFVAKILIWFDREGRYFPWRDAGESKYRLIVTEVLLQRTRAQTVAKFYDNFFEEFSCWESIATADTSRLEEGLKPLGMWKQRAPRLKALAESIMQLSGVVPTSYAAARSLPAVGQYVANAILLFQDIAVIPIIALIPLLGSTVNSGNPPLTELSALTIISIFTAIFLIGRFVLRHVFHFIAATHQREIFTALSLLLVCGMAAIMNLIGLSMALGAFIAGVLLADSEYRHTLESDIEPFKGLLLGLFFISVGMSIDFGLLLQNGWIIVLLTFALIVIKALVLWVVAMLAKIPVSQQALFSSVLSQSGEFGFVLFGFAATASALSYTLAHQLTLIVALSMALTPILLAINQRFIDPRFCTGEDLPMDEISADDGKNPVILVGYGRFGQVVGRLLNANKISTTVIDHNPHQIELVRRYGSKAYFGDALRSDVLHSAGAAQAKIIILAIDDKESTNQAVTLIKKTFPNLTIMARAFDRGHALHLVDLKVGHIKRETFYSALELGKDALVEMGLSVAQAQRVKNTLREHDIETLYQQVAIRDDEKALISVSHSARAQLENILAADQEKYQD